MKVCLTSSCLGPPRLTIGHADWGVFVPSAPTPDATFNVPEITLSCLAYNRLLLPPIFGLGLGVVITVSDDDVTMSFKVTDSHDLLVRTCSDLWAGSGNG